MTGTTVRWWWVRHAPVVNPGNLIYGRSDMPTDLSDLATFDRLAKRLPRQAAWLVTPALRTQQTGSMLIEAGAQPVDDPRVEPDFLEQDFGDWQGRSYAEVAPVRHPFWLAPADFRPPGGESFHDVCDRVGRRLETLSAERRSDDIVVVGHGGTIRAVLAHCLALDPEMALRFRIDTLSLTRVTGHGDAPARRWAVDAVNS